MAGVRSPDAIRALADFLQDSDPDVRFLAIKWVSDEKLTEFRSQIAEILKSRSSIRGSSSD